MGAYIIDSNGESHPMEVVHCKNEDVELQQLLEKNLGLIPGDQINPDDPRRWLVIEREMAVPDPNTGEGRWSIDFVFVDQSGILTFIEVKRHGDTRSRREVIGQMFDYAANGSYYWNSSYLRESAEKYAERNGGTLDEALTALGPDDGLDSHAFFDRVADNLREGQIRLLFFMEMAPLELKSIVDFLNKQMERTEVLLVEAKQYERGSTKIVVPQLFGYTEEARKAKRTIKVESADSRRKWDEDSFFEALSGNVGAQTLADTRALYAACLETGSIKWGTGKKTGSISPKWAGQIAQSPFVIWTDGSLTFQLDYLRGTPAAEQLGTSLAGLLTETFHFEVPEDFEGAFPAMKPPLQPTVLPALTDWVRKSFGS